MGNDDKLKFYKNITFGVYLIFVCMIFFFACQPFLVSSAAIHTKEKPSLQVAKHEATNSAEVDVEDFTEPTNQLRKIRQAVTEVPRSKDKRFLALHKEGIDGGDMLWPKDTALNAIPGVQNRWPGYPGYPDIPYVIDDSLAAYTNIIEHAMYRYARDTCIRFVKRTEEIEYIRIEDGDSCSTTVGRAGASEQPQKLTLGDGCRDIGTILHELGHAIGLYHEQNRSDRDDHIIIYRNNVPEKEAGNFRILAEDDNLRYSKFDYDSIMIYGDYAFSIDAINLKTMVATNGQELLEPYQKTRLTRWDIKKIRRMYKCRYRGNRR